MHDDFFTIGGHSLKVLRVLTLLKEDFSHLTIQDFFKERTIYGLARIEREVKVEKEEVFREYKVIHEPILSRMQTFWKKTDFKCLFNRSYWLFRITHII